MILDFWKRLIIDMIKSYRMKEDKETIEPNSKYLWLFDNGHGGIINGEYQTKGKRSPVWPDGEQIFEGEFNRSIVDRLCKMCDDAGIRYHNIVPEQQDTSLKERVKRANDIYKTDKSCIYVSIHANAGKGTGYEVFSSPGLTKSDGYAEVFHGEFKREFDGVRMRGVKEAKLYVLRCTQMPAILTENFFMDTYTPDFLYLYSEVGRDRIAKAHFEAIKYIEKHKIT